jgi:hypothetical protein
MNIAPLMDFLVSLASLAVTVAVPIVVPVLLKRLNVATDSDLAKRLTDAADAAAGLAYHYALTRNGGILQPDVKAAALAQASAYVQRQVPDSMEHLQVTDAQLLDMINARIGKLLAADPTVSAGKPATSPHPVGTSPHTDTGT